ncbi:MAG: NEL-type E3 ubiquitin ligase domain-containing protein [Chlamydiae bacterium]|nr:NEL-type E3 ubiquitin ligase domain-containing protein [Chlamydiota bacterium]
MHPLCISSTLQQIHPIAFGMGQCLGQLASLIRRVAQRVFEAFRCIMDHAQRLRSYLKGNIEYSIPMELRGEGTDTILFSWLDRILDTANSGNNPSKLTEPVHKILRRAAEDDHFKMIFFHTIEDAAQTCGDRVALSILKLSIEEKKATFTSKDSLTLQQMQEFAEFIIKGPWALDQLEHIAQRHIQFAKNRRIELDEIEVYLAYPILLKDQLQIPIDVDEMLFENFSGVREKNIAQARRYIRGKLEKPNAKAEILASYDYWEVALQKHNETKEEYQAIIEQRQERAELADTGQDYVAINEWFNDQITKVTSRILES